MFFMSMDEFLQHVSDNSDSIDNSLDLSQLEAMPLNVTGSPVDIDGDSVTDGWGFDRDGDGKIDMVQYDFNHDGIADAVGLDTTGDGVIDTIYYDFNHDGVADATSFDSTGDGRIDTLTFAANGISVYSDVGFTVTSAWNAGIARMGVIGTDTDGILEDQAEQLGLNSKEHSWAQKFINEEKMTPEAARKEISFGATCICGKTGCTGCAGLLIDKEIGCQTGACSAGKVIPK